MERELDLFDCLLSVLQKWRKIIVFAILGVACVFLFNSVSAKSETDYREKLKDEQIEKVEDAAETIYIADQRMKKYIENNENSIYQKIDPLAVEVVELEYFVDNHYYLEYPAIAKPNNIVPIVQMYCNSLANDEWYIKMSKEVNDQFSPADYHEVVTVDTTLQDSGTFVVTLLGYDTDMLEKMSQILKEALDSKQKEIFEVYGEHDLLLVEENKRIIKSDTLYEIQISNEARIETLENQILTLEESFVGDESAYLNQLLIEKGVYEEGKTITSPLAYVKTVIIGLALGAIVAIAFYTITYVISNRFHSKSDIEYELNIQLVGTLYLKNKMKSNWIDRTLIKKRDPDLEFFDFEESRKIIATNIKHLAKKYDQKEIVILTDVLSEQEKDQISGIKTLLGTEINIDCLENVLHASESIEKLSNSNAAIIVVKIESSTRAEVQRIINMCAKYDVSIIGALAIN